MMYKRFLVIGSLITILGIGPLSARIMDRTTSLRAGKFSFAGEFEAGLGTGNPLYINLHEGIGLLKGMDLILRQGFSVENNSVYLGGAVKWTLLNNTRRKPGIAAWAGGHYIINASVAGVDGTIMFDYNIKRFTPYIALDTDLEFAENDSDLKLALIPGLRIFLHKYIYLIFEGGIGLAGSPKPHFVSAGLRLTF